MALLSVFLMTSVTPTKKAKDLDLPSIWKFSSQLSLHDHFNQPSQCNASIPPHLLPLFSEHAKAFFFNLKVLELGINVTLNFSSFFYYVKNTILKPICSNNA